MALHHLDLDYTLGIAFAGNIAVAALYGVTCIQTFVYYEKGQGDPRSFRFLIYFLWVLDTLHLLLVTHSLYFYLVTSYGNPISLLFPTWSIVSQVLVTGLSDVIIRAIYGRRVWIVSHSMIILVPLASTAAITFGGGIAFASRAFIEGTFAGLSNYSYIMYIALGSAVVCDILVASSLCAFLCRSRTGFKKTESVVNIVMAYTINSSVLTTVFSVACFVTYTVWPKRFSFIGIYFCIGKLFLNSLLATLNGRSSLKKRVAGISEAPSHISQASGRRVEFTDTFPSEFRQSLKPPVTYCTGEKFEEV